MWRGRERERKEEGEGKKQRKEIKKPVPTKKQAWQEENKG